MNGTDIAAWWGAIIATLVLVWDIYKQRSRKPILFINTTEIVHPNSLIEIQVSNLGSKATTITEVYVHPVPGRVIDKLTGEEKMIPSGGYRSSVKPDERFPLPHRLEPGGVWVGSIDPKNIDHIHLAEHVIIKVRDERSEKAARRIVSVPRLWNESTRFR